MTIHKHTHTYTYISCNQPLGIVTLRAPVSQASENGERERSLRLYLTSENDHAISVEPPGSAPDDVMRETDEFESLSDETCPYIDLGMG